MKNFTFKKYVKQLFLSGIRQPIRLLMEKPMPMVILKFIFQIHWVITCKTLHMQVGDLTDISMLKSGLLMEIT